MYVLQVAADELIAKISEIVPFRRCIIVHEREQPSASKGFVYRANRPRDKCSPGPAHFSYGPSIGIEQYLGCFAISARQDYGFWWRDAGRTTPGLTGAAAELVTHMSRGEGLAAMVRSSAADSVSTLLQLECDPDCASERLTLIISFLAFCLHSSFMLHPVNPALQ